MFIDHRNGGHRTTFQLNDEVILSRKPSSECLSGYQYFTGIKINNLNSFIEKLNKKLPIENKDGDVVIFNDVVPQDVPMKIIHCNYHDTRLIHQLDIHRYIVQYNDQYYYISEYGIKMKE